MDLQTRKIAFVQAFLKLQSERLISRFEVLLKSERDDFQPMSMDEFNARIDQSLEDSENDNFIEAKELLKEIKQWR